MESQRFVWALCACLALLLVLPACKGGKEKPLEPGFPEFVEEGSGAPEVTTGEELPEITAERLERMLFDEATGLKPIYFDFDKYTLRPDALATLRDNADKIKQAPGVIIQIEGHCDERGTQEYNLALGERRALAARAHLIKLGVSGDRLLTISYGEEDPVDPRHNEQAWNRNRRCEFNRAM